MFGFSLAGHSQLPRAMVVDDSLRKETAVLQYVYRAANFGARVHPWTLEPLPLEMGAALSLTVTRSPSIWTQSLWVTGTRAVDIVVGGGCEVTADMDVVASNCGSAPAPG